MFHRFDFSTFRSADQAEREEFCRQFVASLQQHGFCKIVNHYVPPADIDQAFEISRAFFELPLNEKLKSPHPAADNPHRGYSAFGVEKVSTHSNYDAANPMPLLKDMKESYDIGSESDPLWDNIWPPSGVLDTFRPTFTSFYSACYHAELAILEALSLGLGLPAETLANLHKDEINELRLTRYPEVSRSDFAHSTRIAAHTDFGTITLLFQDDVGGLQVEAPYGSGKFIDIDSGGRYECILNVGDCLRKWTGLCSARHRVHLSEAVQTNGSEMGLTNDVVPERYSIAYFAKPDRTASLRPLLGSEADKSNDGTVCMTAGEFQNMRIQGTY
ncbi:Uu.00g026230.m01.CDS01 [Anthostomella pinea]|uniref:Uu.00g026230.m01.CDS01 n=1 Tax=Anthostomella pinea TaxID=933095 RepID=A0AAI8YCJ5_9PEZI|nr:Uu.00g026230.m01.CDS01 [Anthostomella pinea]